MLKMAIVVGHDARRQGAYGNKGLSEYKFWKELTKEIISAVKEENPHLEFKTFYRETYGGYSRVMDRLHNQIDKWGADMTLSLHFNASASRRACGHEVLHYKYSKKGAELAEILNNAFNEYLPNKDRGLVGRTRYERGGGFLYKGKSYCILSEPYFASNQDLYVKNGAYRKALIDSFVLFYSSI